MWFFFHLCPYYKSLERCFAEGRFGRMVLAALVLPMLAVTADTGTIALLHLLIGICCYLMLAQLLERKEILSTKAHVSSLKLALLAHNHLNGKFTGKGCEVEATTTPALQSVTQTHV